MNGLVGRGELPSSSGEAVGDLVGIALSVADAAVRASARGLACAGRRSRRRRCDPRGQVGQAAPRPARGRARTRPPLHLGVSPRLSFLAAARCACPGPGAASPPLARTQHLVRLERRGADLRRESPRRALASEEEDGARHLLQLAASVSGSPKACRSPAAEAGRRRVQRLPSASREDEHVHPEYRPFLALEGLGPLPFPAGGLLRVARRVTSPCRQWQEHFTASAGIYAGPPTSRLRQSPLSVL